MSKRVDNASAAAGGKLALTLEQQVLVMSELGRSSGATLTVAADGTVAHHPNPTGRLAVEPPEGGLRIRVRMESQYPTRNMPNVANLLLSYEIHGRTGGGSYPITLADSGLACEADYHQLDDGSQEDFDAFDAHLRSTLLARGLVAARLLMDAPAPQRDDWMLGVRASGRLTEFFWRGGYDTRELPKAAGFSWDGSERCWATSDPDSARELLRYADPLAAAELAQQPPAGPEGDGGEPVATPAQEEDTQDGAPAPEVAPAVWGTVSVSDGKIHTVCGASDAGLSSVVPMHAAGDCLDASAERAAAPARLPDAGTDTEHDDEVEGIALPSDARAAKGAEALRAALAGPGLPPEVAQQAKARWDGSLMLWHGCAEQALGTYAVGIARVVRTSDSVRVVGNLPAPPDGYYHPFRLDCDRGEDGVWSYFAGSVADGHDEDGCAGAAGATAAEALGALARHMSVLGMGGAIPYSLLDLPEGDWLGCPVAPPGQPTGQEYRDRREAVENAAMEQCRRNPRQILLEYEDIPF